MKDGGFWRDGKGVRALGVNYFDCFLKMLSEDAEEGRAAEKRCAAGFKELRGLGIPFVRFNAGGFYPRDWRLYEREPAVYFARLEKLVELAEGEELGLVPSLFWTFFTQPGRAGEPLSAWGDPGSRTHGLMQRYVAEVVGRFRRSPAVWAWELGNEYNLEVDVPDQRELRRKWFHPSLGMPAEPGERDVLSSADMRTAQKAFAEAVRAADPDRAVFTGHSMPRTAAWHLERGQGWTADSVEQWSAVLEAQNPPPFSGLSVHWYPFHPDDGTGVAGDPVEATLAACTAVARRTGQPLWVGEFGPAPEAAPEVREAQLTTMLNALESHKVGLAAAWVYDFPHQPENNLSAAANRKLLEKLAEASARWQA